MRTLHFFLTFIISGICVYFFLSSKLKNRNQLQKVRLNITQWMKMTRNERHALDEKDYKRTFARKKKLLNKIRQEYVSLIDKNNN